MRQRGFTLSKRGVAFALLCAFTLQGSGAAQAAASPRAENVQPLLAEMRSDIGVWFAALQATRLGAVLSGGASRWDAMHAPPPAHPHAMRLDPRLTLQERPIRPQWRGAGMRLRGPAMLARPQLPTQRFRSLLPAPRRVINPQVLAPHGRPALILGAPRHILTVTSGSSNLTGINPWWTYEEGAIPGVGKYMVNVANGNVILQTNDVDIPERGIDLAFRRTYNSFSKNDWNASGGNDDGSNAPSTYGSGWTNTFDAHLAPNDLGGLTVYDIDGARYDYAPSGTCLNPPAGQYATLCSDGGNGYFWTKKSGTVYYFYGPNRQAPNAGYSGRLVAIYGRNSNNAIHFTYSWLNGDASSTANLTQIVAAHSDGQSLTLNFGTINGKVLLSSITRPDGSQITYAYGNPSGNNAYGNLEEVDLPGNNQGTLKHQYGYYSSTGILNWVASPRWFMSGGTDGAYTWFNYNGANQVSWIQLYGIANWAIPDGTGSNPVGSGTLLQPGMPSGPQTIAATTFAYPSGETQLTDVDGHASNWLYDASGRVNQTQEWTGSLWLTTSASWDARNNLTESVDARGYATDYAYDTNGNATAVAAPSVATNEGTFRPTSLYSYDGNSNLAAYCDPVETHSLGKDWVGNPGTGDSLCPNQSGATRYTWDTADGNEPTGFITDTYMPLGYHRSYQYTTSQEGGGDYGLPTAVIGDAISQPLDGSTPTRTPMQTFTYDSYGNLSSYNKGEGAWQLHYDSLNQLTTSADPDGYTSYIYYYANGQKSKTETPYQHARSVGPSFTYDSDGDEFTESAYHGGSFVPGGAPTLPSAASVTTNYHDGADRLVEVQQPRNSSGAGEAYTSPWITRYFYDLSQSGNAGLLPSFGGQTITAHGNLFKTVELVPATDTIAFSNTAETAQNGTFRDMKGNAFDAVDRPVTRFFYVFQTNQDALQQENLTYDASNPLGSGNNGMLSQDCNGLQQCTYYAYDSDDRVSQTQHTASPALDRTFTYDPDARPASIVLPSWGTQSYSYDADGRTRQSVEPSGIDSPATLTYHYYPDGLRSSLDVSSSALNQTGLFTFGYRADAVAETQQITDSGNSLVGTTTLTFSYSAAGRFKQRSESGPAANGTPTQYQYDPTYGYLSEMDYPAGKETSIEYDPSGAALGWTSSVLSSSSSYQYSVRGELLTYAQPNMAGAPKPPVNIMANGVAVNTSYTVSKTLSTTSWSATLDPRMGVVLGSNATDTGGDASSQGVAFDAIGRATSDPSEYDPGTGCDTCKVQDYATLRSYDQENHTVGTSLQYCGAVGGGCILATYASATYDWGAGGHPMRIVATKGTTGTETLHWDGDQLLFTTRSGVLDDIKIGVVGDITPQDTTYAGLTFWDRDPGRSAVYCHNATGAAGNGEGTFDYTTGYKNVSDTFNHSPCALASGQTMTTPSSMIWGAVAQNTSTSAMIGSGGIIAMPRSDGLNDGFNVIQGGRVYDPTLGGWTTPDAYQGEIHDPMSQKAYLWNRNSPVSFTDPSGYDAYAPSYDIISWGAPNHPYSVLPEDGVDTLGAGLQSIANDAAIEEIVQSKGEPDPRAPGTLSSALNILMTLLKTALQPLKQHTEIWWAVTNVSQGLVEVKGSKQDSVGLQISASYVYAFSRYVGKLDGETAYFTYAPPSSKSGDGMIDWHLINSTWMHHSLMEMPDISGDPLEMWNLFEYGHGL